MSALIGTLIFVTFLLYLTFAAAWAAWKDGTPR